MYLEHLLSTIKSYDVNYFLLATKSEFCTEYLPDYAKILELITGFDGSNAFCFISSKKIVFITDGRYLLQAEKQLSKIQIPFMILDIHETDFKKKLKNSFGENVVVGYNPRILTEEDLEILENPNITYKPLEIDVFSEKPVINKKAAFIYDLKYCGLSYKDKVNAFLMKLKSEYYFFSSPMSICWLLNIRGQDISYNAIFLCYAILEKKTKSLKVFCDEPNKLSVIEDYDNISIHHTQELISSLNSIAENNKSISSTKKTTIYHKNLFGNLAKIEDDYCNSFRSIKEQNEIEYAKKIHLEDGLAFMNFWFWLEENLKNQKLIDELQVSKYLEKFRSLQPSFFCQSFETIAAFKGNGAIIHYKPNHKTNSVIKGDGLLLIDSGGHYFGGTTDVTRVISIGKPTPNQKKHYTVVLKSHLKLANCTPPKHTPVHQLNSIARYELWQEKMDFEHGVGHGVSNFIEVHESPYSINARCTQPLVENLILSNEPGFYLKDEYGIRIENLMYSKACHFNEKKTFIQFENLTMIPYETELIDKNLLNTEEINQINSYHNMIYKLMKGEFQEEKSDWFSRKTQTI